MVQPASEKTWGHPGRWPQCRGFSPCRSLLEHHRSSLLAELLGVSVAAGWLGSMGRKRQPGHLLQPVPAGEGRRSGQWHMWKWRGLFEELLLLLGPWMQDVSYRGCWVRRYEKRPVMLETSWGVLRKRGWAGALQDGCGTGLLLVHTAPWSLWFPCFAIESVFRAKPPVATCTLLGQGGIKSNPGGRGHRCQVTRGAQSCFSRLTHQCSWSLVATSAQLYSLVNGGLCSALGDHEARAVN